MAGTENTIFSDAIIKLKHATKSVADASDKVLEKDEVLLVSPNSGSGTGAYEMRVGDGSTPVKNLPVAINGMKADNINVEEIETIEEENPTLEGGNAIKNLFGRISKKFSWLETMLGKKVNTADIYDGLDSSNAGKVASANAVRQINEKTDKNTTDISTLTSNLFPNNGKIPDGTDFNSLLTVGKYFVVSNDRTLTMTNVPEQVAGRLFVLNMLGNEKVLNKEYQYFIQIYLLYTGTLWMRTLRRENDGSPIIFDNWVKRW